MSTAGEFVQDNQDNIPIRGRVAGDCAALKPGMSKTTAARSSWDDLTVIRFPPTPNCQQDC
jgi:hypothetical protein